MNKDIKLFPCYSPKLMKYLTEEKRIKYKLVALNPLSKKTMWIFIDDEELNSAIKQWRETNPNK